MVTMVTSTTDANNARGTEATKRKTSKEPDERGRSRTREDEQKRSRNRSKSNGSKSNETNDHKRDQRPMTSPKQSREIASPVRAKTMKRGTTKPGTPVKSPARKTTKYRYELRNSTRKGAGRGGGGRHNQRAQDMKQSKLSDRLVNMATGAVGMLLGTTPEETNQREVRIKQEMIQESERYNQTWEQARDKNEESTSAVKETENKDNMYDMDTDDRVENGVEHITIESDTDDEEVNVVEKVTQEAIELTNEKKKRMPNPYTKKKIALEIVRAREETDKNNQNQENRGETLENPKEGTPPASGSRQLWSSVVAPQTMIRTHEKVMHEYRMYAEMGFQVDRNCKDLPPTVAQAIVREALINIFKRGKEVDHKFAINPYFEGTNLHTIKKVEDIPHEASLLKSYIPHLYQRTTKIRQGRNSGFLTNLTFTIPPEEFIHHWELSKREYKRVPYVQIKMTPMQDSETFNTVGFLVNSSEKQCVKQLQEDLAKELGMKIGIAFRQAAVDRNTKDGCWKNAKRGADGNSRTLFSMAPMAMQIYTDSKENALTACAKLYSKYGKEINGQYPRFPDGTRMKFVPATHFLDMRSRKQAKGLLLQQIWIQSNTIEAPLPIKDPYQRFEQQGNRSMMELLLDLQCPERDNEPYFRQITKKWTKDYDDKRYEATTHTNMYGEAASILRNLEEVLTREYGPEVAAALGNPPSTGEDDFQSVTSGSLITLDTEDRYMTGKGKFIFEGLDKIPGMQEEIRETEERSIHIRSTTSGLTDHQTINSDQKTDDGQTENMANQAVDRNIGTHPHQQGHYGDNEGFTRVGTMDDEERLRRRMKENNPPDPGGQKGQRRP